MNISATRTPTTTTPSNWLSLSTVLSSTELYNLNAMLSSYSKSVLLYKATRDGFQASAFHSRCDNIPNTVTVIRNNMNYVFGGFTAAKWSSTAIGASGVADPNAFIFSLRRNGGLTNYKLPIKSTQVNNAIFGWSSYGPIFGYDIIIYDQSNIYNGSYSGISSYTPPTYPSGSDIWTFLTGGFQNWLTTEIEVYQLF